jgi:hypothetical protein
MIMKQLKSDLWTDRRTNLEGSPMTTIARLLIDGTEAIRGVEIAASLGSSP